MVANMKEPYVYSAGDPDCPHENVSITTLTTSPPIHQWTCDNPSCRRIVRQDGEETKVVMPEVQQVFDPTRYPNAKMRLEDNWLYRTNALYGEEEETPEEFEVTDDILRAYNKHQWYRAFYEIEVGARYNLKTGEVEVVSVQGVPLERPVRIMP